MWNAKKSLTLSKVFTLLCMLGLALALISGPWLVHWVIRVSLSAQAAQSGCFLATVYAGGAAAALLLVWLYRLLHNLGLGQVFTPKNVSLLRGISWYCYAGAGICIVSMVYYLPWGLVALAAGFGGLIVRVVKNVVAEAVVLKEENDYTI